jgi:hydroxymethylpyrimidine/phosphomethylpyrimidine kinase
LLPQVSLITPNLPEAAALLDAPHARNEREMVRAFGIVEMAAFH